MRIIVVRHEKVDMTWDRKYNSVAYDLACEHYDRCPIAFPDKKYAKITGAKKVYVSGLSRTYETACRLFDGTDFVKTTMLNEVPLRSFKDTERSYPVWVWNFIGRFQWFLGKSRQPESREQTRIRVREMIRLLEKRQEDCYLVTHGFYMRVLISELRRCGYRIRREKIIRSFGISNLDRVVAVK
ncbi:MAG: histidine phosphatase family protein [Lachnospiraceae bacterium]|nr:histidine phosphatase family protein [Lachnospiraceae bacterium]